MNYKKLINSILLGSLLASSAPAQAESSYSHLVTWKNAFISFVVAGLSYWGFWKVTARKIEKETTKKSNYTINEVNTKLVDELNKIKQVIEEKNEKIYTNIIDQVNSSLENYQKKLSSSKLLLNTDIQKSNLQELTNLLNEINKQEKSVTELREKLESQIDIIEENILNKVNNNLETFKENLIAEINKLLRESEDDGKAYTVFNKKTKYASTSKGNVVGDEMKDPHSLKNLQSSDKACLVFNKKTTYAPTSKDTTIGADMKNPYEFKDPQSSEKIEQIKEQKSKQENERKEFLKLLTEEKNLKKEISKHDLEEQKKKAKLKKN